MSAVVRRARRGGVRSSGRDEEGNAVVELVWLGILLIVPVLWIVVSVFTVQKGAFGVSGAARAAVRAYALAPDDASGERAARQAARQALDDQGLHTPVDVVVSCTPYPSECHQGTSVITVRIDSHVDVPMAPKLFGTHPSIALHATSTEPYGRYEPLAAGPADEVSTP